MHCCTGKQVKKGKEVEYTCIEMAEYLQPLNNKLSIEQKREMYAARNRMVNIPYNFPKKKHKHHVYYVEKTKI